MMLEAKALPVTETAQPTQDFGAFFEREYARLVRALFLIAGGAPEAEDLAQEAMVRMYERWDRVTSMASPAGYLYRTAMNLHRSRLRRLRTWSKAMRAAPLDPGPEARADTTDRLDRTLDSLPAGLRAALVLVEWMGFTAEEAGVVLGIEPVSVRVRLSRAKATVRRTLEDAGG